MWCSRNYLSPKTVLWARRMHYSEPCWKKFDQYSENFSLKVRKQLLEKFFGKRCFLRIAALNTSIETCTTHFWPAESPWSFAREIETEKKILKNSCLLSHPLDTETYNVLLTNLLKIIRPNSEKGLQNL